RVAHAGNSLDLVLDVYLRVVAQVLGVETRVVGGERAHHEDGRLALLHRDPVTHDLLGQLRLGERDLVLHVHRREVRVARDVEVDRQVHDAGARVRRLEVQQPVEPLAAGSWRATALTGRPGAACWTPSTITRSPVCSPSAISHDPPSQDVATTLRTATLPLSATTYTNAPPRPCCTARCGTRIA